MKEIVIPVVLAGGAGTRLWPLSREMYPKQFLNLTGDDTMLQATLRRAGRISSQHPVIVTHQDYRFIVTEQMAEAGLPPAQLLLEPLARNTAIAIAVAAHLALQRNADAILFVQPADHIIQDEAALRRAVEIALPAAALGQLMSFGITPRFPATGYGYIARGEALASTPGCWRMARFVEKPDALQAAQFLQSGEYLWNSGMFLLRADCYLHELRQWDPLIADAAQAAVANAASEDHAIHLARAAYEAAPARSIDYAVMEHTLHAGVVPCEIGWSDVGNWSALWDIGEKDAQQNVIVGDAIIHATENCYIRSGQQLVATYGIKDAVVVATPDVVMVSSRHEPQAIKYVVEELQRQNRAELIASPRRHRPWGICETLIDYENYKVQKLILKPRAQLPMQRHQHRSEHWVVVSGIAEVEIIENKSQIKRELRPNTSVYVPRGAMHRITNIGDEFLKVIEVQCGDYLGEDDIEYFDGHAA